MTIGPDDVRVETAVIPLPPRELRTPPIDVSGTNAALRVSLSPLTALLATPHAFDAVLAIDAEMPYLIVSQVLIRLGTAGVSAFHFVVTSGGTTGFALGSFDIHLPARGNDGFPAANPSAPIEVRLHQSTMTIHGSGKTAPDGCGGLPIVGGETSYDFAAVTRCGAALKKTYGLSDDLMLLVSPGVPFHVVVSTMDALAVDYPRVRLGVLAGE